MRIGINLLKKQDCTLDDERSAFRRPGIRYVCSYCTFEDMCSLDSQGLDCPFLYSGTPNKEEMENCNIAGHDLDEVCNMLANKEPSKVKEILLKLGHYNDEGE